jgi:hypothetical protein
MFIAHASLVVSLSSARCDIEMPLLRSLAEKKSIDDYKHVAPHGAESRNLNF